METQTEAIDRVVVNMANQGLASTDTQETATRHLGDKAEDDPEFAAPMGRNIIVAIGINQYQHHPPLDNPINDAQAVLTLFKQCGFEELPDVPSLVANDATRSAIADLPERLAAELMPDDNLVLFFAGHGEKRETQAPDPAEPGKTHTHRTGYLIPVDGPQNKPGDWINLDAFLDGISGLPARHIFVILDACKSGIALAEKFKTKGGDQPAAIAALRQRPSRRVMTSAMHDEKAAEGGSGSGHSVFAEALIAAVQDRQADMDDYDGYITTVNLFSFVQGRVSDRAMKLFKLRQTPDYGYLPGDGSGDLVISLREGAFNRLIGLATNAMLRHDVPQLQVLVDQLLAVNPDYAETLYLLFRLKFMQGDIQAATQLARRLRGLQLKPGTLPLSQTELTALSVQLGYYGPLFAVQAGSPPIKIKMLTGKSQGMLQSAALISSPAGDAYQIENGELAQFEVTNLSDRPVHLYFIAVVPTGRLVIGPVLDPSHWDIQGLEPQGTGVGRAFHVKGLPGSLTETHILSSPKIFSDLRSPPSVSTIPRFPMNDPILYKIQMTTVLYQISDDLSPGPDDFSKQ